MADLTWDIVRGKLPAGSIEDIDGMGNVSIQLGYLLEKPIQLDSDNVGEFLCKFLIACNARQVQLRQNNEMSLDSYSAPTYSAPVKGSDGNWYSTITQTVRLRVKVDPSEVNAISI